MACAPLGLPAAVSLPAIIGDNMVLQAGKRVPIWGWADPGEAVRVEFAGQEVETVANATGHWEVQLSELTPTDKGTDLTITGTNAVVKTNVIVGEVWLCSGQSNMGWRVEQSDNAEAEIAAATFPAMRLFTVKRAVADEGPRDDCEGEWVICSPETVG